MPYALVDYIGIEFETDCPHQGQIKYGPHFSEDHDGSIESRALKDRETGRVYDLFSKGVIKGQNLSEIKVGVEYVSVPLDSLKEVSKKAIEDLVAELNRIGEPDTSDRAGIHIHVSFAYNPKILKNLIKITAYLEQVLFQVAGMGYTFRGQSNSAIYCRPLTKWGPPCVETDRGWAQSFNIKDLVKATSSEEFFDMYCNIDERNQPHKYYPVRYLMMTLFNLLGKSTVEFRVFNKSLNPSYIWAVINLCKKICEIALTGEFNLPENSVYDVEDKDQIVSTLREFANFSGLDKETLEILETIIYRTPLINLPKKYVKSHLYLRDWGRGGKFWQNSKYRPPIIKEEIETPVFVDFRALQENPVNTLGF